MAGTFLGASEQQPERHSVSDTESFEFTFHKYLDDSAKIEVDPNPNIDIDNAFDDGESLTESIFNYHNENGRTYHSFRAGSYYFPNDQIEIERLDNQHDLLRIVLDGRNYLAPWSKENPPKKVLDVATGTGKWAVEMGDEFQTAEIIGIDLSPIQPTIVPPNVSFYVEDATEDWHEEGLDYIHTRMTSGCWSDMGSELIVKAFAHLAPGGWLETQEIQDSVGCDDDTLTAASPFYNWCNDIAAASVSAQRPLRTPGSQIKEMFVRAGFVDVHEKVYKLPLNGWPRNPRLKRIGEMWQMNMQNGLQGFSYGYMHRALGKTKEEIEVSLVNVRKDIANPMVHMFMKFYVVWGRKPEANETTTVQ